MTKDTSQVFLNRFAVKQLSDREKTVQVYSYTFNPSPELGKEYSAINQIPWKIRTPGVRFKSTIITKQLISEEYLKQDNWTLEHQGTQLLNLDDSYERESLEKLERKWLERELKYKLSRNRVDRALGGGFIWWDANNIILQDLGWEVHTGVRLDVELHHSGVIFIEIDLHHRFYSAWTLEQWLQDYKDIPINWVRNTYDDRSWKFIRVSDEKPENTMIPNLGSLADYHRNIDKNKATEKEIKEARVVYVSSKGKELTHLSTRVRPSITMEILSQLQDRGSTEAAKVFTQVKKTIQQRFDKSNNTAQWLSRNIYNSNRLTKPQETPGTILRNNTLILLTKSTKVDRPIKSLERGCFKTGEQQFGCLDLTENGNWSKFVSRKLESVAQKSGVDILLEPAQKKSDLPDEIFTRKQFWQDWSDRGTKTILVISNWLQNTEKVQLQKEALEANIALQFMQPMYKEEHRIANIILGLLLKAQWQPVGLEPLQDEYAAEIVIGFDAGTNRNLYYGTSAFAILANGQSLGWELPEAQPGEKISSEAIIRTVTNIVTRFKKIENRLPRRILMLRDGIVQCEEFDDVVAALLDSKIAVDLLSVRKSGAGRMAVKNEYGQFTDASPGTAILSTDNKTFRLVTSKPIQRVGGSARPLKVVRDYGDAPLETLAKQVDRLSMLNPASAYAYSRLPYVIHFADKMAKTVQRIGEVGILHGLDRQKIFFA